MLWIKVDEISSLRLTIAVPRIIFEADLTVSTMGLSVGEGIQAILCAHLMPLKDRINYTREWDCKVFKKRALLCFQLRRNVSFKWNMDNFNFLSRGQLESLNLDKFLLTGFKTITFHRVFLVTWVLSLLLECCAEIILTRPSQYSAVHCTW